MGRETIIFSLFCILNGLLSLNCLFYHIVRPHSSERYTYSPREEKRMRYVSAVLLEDGLKQKVHLQYSDGEDYCMDTGQMRLVRQAAEWERCSSAEKPVPMRLLPFERPFPISDPYRTAQIGIYIGPEKETLYIFFEWERNGKILSSGSYRWGKDTGYNLLRIKDCDGKEISRLNPPLQKAVFLQDGSEFFAAVPEKNILRFSNVYNTNFSEKKLNPMYYFWSALSVPAFGLDIITYPIQYAVYRMSRR